MPEDPAKPPRFPYVAALLCIACVGMAGYTWMRYSFAWRVTPEELYSGGAQWYNAKFVQVRGEVVPLPGEPITDRPNVDEVLFVSRLALPVHHEAVLLRAHKSDIPLQLCTSSWRGRVSAGGDSDVVTVDTTASRFHGGSIAGLVVGAMGVFVFAVALRHWLGERRAHEAPAEEAPSEPGLRPE